MTNHADALLAIMSANRKFIGACAAIVGSCWLTWPEKLQRLVEELKIRDNRHHRAVHEPAYALYLIYGSDR